MKPKTYGYIGGGLLAAVIVAISGWGPMAAGDSSQNPVFAVDPSWPNPLPAPIGSDGAAHPWVTGEVAGSCTDKFDNVYTFNRGWEVGVTVNGVLRGNQGGAIVGQDAGRGWRTIVSGDEGPGGRPSTADLNSGRIAIRAGLTVSGTRQKMC
jgi:hypothetical protein